LGDNRPVRRGLLLAGVWVFGAAVAVAFAFAAVGRVASGVAAPNASSLSRGAIDNELTATTARPRTGGARPTSPQTSSTTAPKTPGPSSTLSRPPASEVPTTSTALPPPTPTPVPAPTTTTVTSAPSSGDHNTVTTSQGGAVWTRCSGPDTISYVAAVPKSGYQRTVDIEDSRGIEQEFENGSHRSKIDAACSNGVVHAQVEEEAAADH
jgi:hypothetical protein